MIYIIGLFLALALGAWLYGKFGNELDSAEKKVETAVDDLKK